MKVLARRIGDLPPDLSDDRRLGRLSWWGARLSRLGIAPGAAGNLSVRYERGFVITRTEVELASIEPGDWVRVVDLERRSDGTLEVSYLGDHTPSRDSFVHGTVYRRRPTAQSIFHLHDSEMLERADRLSIPSTDRFFPAGTSESVSEIERLLDRDPEVGYFVLVQHGIVAWGADPDEAGSFVETWHGKAEELHD